jgi:hypothetical protein
MRRRIDHGMHAAQRGRQSVAGGEIADRPFDVGPWPPRSREDAHLVSVSNQAIHEILSEMAGASGDENKGHVPAPFVPSRQGKEMKFRGLLTDGNEHGFTGCHQRYLALLVFHEKFRPGKDLPLPRAHRGSLRERGRQLA